MLAKHGRSKGIAWPLWLRAYFELLRAGHVLARGGFAPVYQRVKNFPRKGNGGEARTLEHICRAVDVACVLYFKEVRCLQRSAAAACLLRGNGIPAELVIGVRHWPFCAHAWVEVSGRVVNDKPSIIETYAVMDRC
jgi:prolyl oligopeptidase